MAGDWQLVVSCRLLVAGDCSDLFAEKREAVPFLFSVFSGLTVKNQ